jgi:hypothetical protein
MYSERGIVDASVSFRTARAVLQRSGRDGFGSIAKLSGVHTSLLQRRYTDTFPLPKSGGQLAISDIVTEVELPRTKALKLDIPSTLLAITTDCMHV